LKNIAYIDLEVDPEKGKVFDLTVLHKDGAAWHARQAEVVSPLLTEADFLCGLTILHLPYPQ